MARAGPLETKTASGGRSDRRGVGYEYHLLRAREQALDDLARARAAEVVFLRIPRTDAAEDHLGALAERALAAGFAAAHVTARSDAAFDTLEGMVRATARALHGAGVPRARPGLIALLDAYSAQHGARAAEQFDAACEREMLRGELASLAGGYLASRRRADAARVEAFLAGTSLARADAEVDAGATLNATTAKRVLADLTRLNRALGYRGTLLTVSGADLVAQLSPARREAAYTVLRELVDNADGGRGMVATQIIVAASTSFFQGARSLTSLPPLLTRLAAVRDAPADETPPPHRPIVDLAPPEAWERAPLPPVLPAPEGHDAQLRAIIRVSHGLPPLELVSAMSVGVERIDGAVDALFEHTDVDGSVFALLVGEYGTGKTHFLLHLAARALAARRPVLRLSLERLDADLGHPERHLARLLDSALVAPAGTGGAFERLAKWTATPGAVAVLARELQAIAQAGGEASSAAGRALEWARTAPRPRAALEAYLSGRDLASKRPRPALRQEAYARLLLWLALLERLEGAAGPVLLIDEAENLYRGGLAPADRRTALRSLSFYCSGALPRACVVLAITPEALESLRAEAPTLLTDVAEQRTVLPSEDAAMLARRVKFARPLRVPPLDRTARAALLARLYAAHAAVRGAGDRAAWERYAARLAEEATTPRELVRRATDFLERAWWNEAAG